MNYELEANLIQSHSDVLTRPRFFGGSGFSLQPELDIF